jgi:membrane-bound lytic murein transglycosylase D
MDRKPAARPARGAAALRCAMVPLGLVAALATGCAMHRTDLAAPGRSHGAGDRTAGIEDTESTAAAPAAPAPPEPAPPDEGLEPVAEEAIVENGGEEGVEADIEPAEGEPITPSPLDELAEVEPELDPGELEESRELVAEQAPSFDIPIVINEPVLAWVDRFSGSQKAMFQAALGRSGRYEAMFRRIFAEEGVPQDLVYMAAVESAYKTTAYSRAHAKGIFQFISSTARLYGLRVDYWVDERSDPERSARAAARYMKALHDEFGDWYLALAAYNAGEGKIRRAIARTGERDFWALAHTRHLRRETKNHIPAIIAAALLSKEPEKHGLTYEPAPPLAYDTVTVEGAADLAVLAGCAGVEVEALKELNPAIRRGQTPPDGRTELRVPPGTGGTTLAALEAIPPRERVRYAEHRVRRGETLSVIARHHGVTVRSIQQANGLGGRTLIRTGQVLRIPTSSASVASAGSDEPVQDAGVVAYRVRRGDTLSGIARRHGTTPTAIAAASGIGVDKVLRVGETLTVVSGAKSAAEAVRVAGGELVASAAPRRADPPVVHTVRRGETLSRIASLYSTSVRALCSLNGITPRTIIRPGLKLTVRH